MFGMKTAKTGISRREMLRQSGILGAGLLATAGCGGTGEGNTAAGAGAGIVPRPDPIPGNAGLTFRFVKTGSLALPTSTATIEFVYLDGTNGDIGSETVPFSNSVTVYPPNATRVLLMIARDADGFPTLELQGGVPRTRPGTIETVDLSTFSRRAVTFESLSVRPSQFELSQVGATQQLALTAGFSNGETITFSPALLSEATYVSDNVAAATVSGSGLVTAVVKGVATVSVTFIDSTGQSRSANTVANVTAEPLIPAVSFVQPPVRRSVNGFLSVLMQIDFTTSQVGTPYGVKNYASRTINGTLAPPTVRIKPGDHLEFPIDNLLPADNNVNSPTYQGPVNPPNQNTPHEWNTINMHTHGFHVSPAQDNVLLQIPPGNTYVYKYDLPTDHPDGSYWYHPHKHGATAMHLLSGMAGMIIVEGALDEVPEIKAAADLVFNINELNLGGLGTDPNRAEYYCPNNTGPNSYQVTDSVYIVNGEFQPRLKVRPGQLVRLRILNASARSATPLTISGATNNWNIIAFDGLTLPEMLSNIPEFNLQPANRADVLVRFDAAGTYEITKQAYAPGGGGTLPLQILAFVDVEGEPFPQSFPSGKLPVSPTLPNIGAAEVNDNRLLVYNTNPFRIGATQFNASTINQTIPLGSVIEWRLENSSNIPHPHHIHIQDMQVIATSDGALNGLQFTTPGENFPVPVWVDTVGIPPKVGNANGWVIVRQRFLDFPGLFVQHCHILTHEDQGMMQLINVV